ncbi:MAG TPA: hypothetical protein VEK34_09655 [Methylocella sp.]|nr:hypothetical protein [Methylocella sp.]
MPTFDGGHYFLTVLAPIKKEPIAIGATFTSPVNVLRERLASLPVIGQRPSIGRRQSPFARNTRNHFVRFAIIDDVAYNGREEINVLLMLLKNIDPTVAQPQDHLNCSFLLFLVEFDAANGTDTERDTYLTCLWDTMSGELRSIFTCCVGFDETVSDATSFAKFIARCQIETTMSFNDYYVEDPHLPSWSWKQYLVPSVISLAIAALGFASGSFVSVPIALILFLAGVGSLGAVIWHGYTSIMAAGAKPYPAAPDTNLPSILKALHLQGAFAQFAIANQGLVGSPHTSEQLHAAFGKFLMANRPEDLEAPTQPPGVYGI